MKNDKNIFEICNDINVDHNEYETCQLSDVEKQKMKKRLKKKLRGRSSHKKAKIAVTAAAAAIAITFFSLGLNSNITVANVPIIGSILEEYIDVQGESFDDYKTIIGTTVEDKGIEVKLNEVLLDESQLLISSTFRSYEVDLEKTLFPSPKVYINGQEIPSNGTGSKKKIDDCTYTFFASRNIENLKIEGGLDIKIVYSEIFYSDRRDYSLNKEINGNWVFEFKATGDNLLAQTRTIPINRSFQLDNGQKIIVEDLTITPVSTRLNYTMPNITMPNHTILNDKQYELHFEMQDNQGNIIKAMSALTFTKDSYNRFGPLNDKTTILKITPYVLYGEAGQDEHHIDFHKAFTIEEEAFEINLENGHVN